MVKLIQLKTKEYMVICSDANEHIVGTMRQARIALHRCEVDDAEIDFALEEFAKGDDYAEFGINRTLLFTEKLARPDSQVQ